MFYALLIQYRPVTMFTIPKLPSQKSLPTKSEYAYYKGYWQLNRFKK